MKTHRTPRPVHWLGALSLLAGVTSTASAQTVLADWDFTNATSGTTAGTAVDVGLGAVVLANTEVVLAPDVACTDMLADSIWNGDPCGPNGLQWSGGGWVASGELNLQKWDGDVLSSCGTNNDGVNDNYIAFTLTATSGTLTLDTITVEAWRNGAGAPSLYGVDVCVDGGAAVPFGSRFEDTGTGTPSSVVSFTDVVTGATTVEVRFVPADGASSSAGTGNLHIDGLAVHGAVVSVPGCVDDAFEDNDNCGTALPGTLGSTTGLVLLGPAGPTGARDDDYWTYVVPAGEYINIDVLFTDADGDVDARLYHLDPACPGTQVDTSGSVSDNEAVSWLNTTGVPATVALRVYLFGNFIDCQTYDLLVVTSTCGPDDAYEQNDTCATAAALAGWMLTADLVVYGTAGPTGAADDDYYLVTVPDTIQLDVDLYFAHADGDMDLRLYDVTAGCPGAQVASSGSVTDDESATWTNTTGASATIAIHAFLYGGSGDCQVYDLDWILQDPNGPCFLPDDAFEENDDCSAAATITDGLYPDLWVSTADGDHYALTVPAGFQLDAQIDFDSAAIDIDLWLWAAADPNCGNVNTGTYLTRAWTTWSPETISWVNTSGVDVPVVLQVDVYSFNACALYDLELSVDYPAVGTVMCAGDGTGGPCPCGNEASIFTFEGCANSTGVGAITGALGTPSVANDDAVFTLTQAVATELAVLVQGSAAFVYPFRDGIYCMSNPTERMEFITTDAAGSGQTTVSVATVGAVVAGSTMYYQWYYRDMSLSAPCGGGGNFASGLEVTWLP